MQVGLVPKVAAKAALDRSKNSLQLLFDGVAVRVLAP
jgi:hypothetical protein